MLRPLKMNDPGKKGEGSPTTWDTGVNRWSFAFGWSLSSHIHTKLSYSNQTRDDEIGQTHDWTLRALLSVIF